jgi:hypothetical protein
MAQSLGGSSFMFLLWNLRRSWLGLLAWPAETGGLASLTGCFDWLAWLAWLIGLARLIGFAGLLGWLGWLGWLAWVAWLRDNKKQNKNPFK